VKFSVKKLINAIGRGRGRAGIAVHGTPSHSYRVSLAIWDQTPNTSEHTPPSPRPMRPVLDLPTRRDGILGSHIGLWVPHIAGSVVTPLDVTNMMGTSSMANIFVSTEIRHEYESRQTDLPLTYELLLLPLRKLGCQRSLAARCMACSVVWSRLYVLFKASWEASFDAHLRTVLASVVLSLLLRSSLFPNTHTRIGLHRVLNSGRLGAKTPKNFSPDAQISRRRRHDVQMKRPLIMSICL